jgi:hypothetical protein
MWKIDPNTNASIIIYTEHVSQSGTVREDYGGRRRRKMIRSE